MGLIQKEVSIFISLYNLSHFLSKGYKCINGQRIVVKVKDLPKGSGKKVKVKCDYCGEEFFQSYRRYLEHPQNVCCLQCRPKKFSETNLKKFGCKCSLHNPEIHEKVSKTWLSRYGTTIPTKAPEIQNKIRQTRIEKYGVEFPILSEEIRHKSEKSYRNIEGAGIIPTSKEQKRICDLYKGKLNYCIENFFVDIFVEEDKICCEYDGGGHNLGVIHKRITQEELDKKDRERDQKLVDLGYKVFRIIHNRKQVSDEYWLSLYRKALVYLVARNNNIYIYNVEKEIEKIL